MNTAEVLEHAERVQFLAAQIDAVLGKLIDDLRGQDFHTRHLFTASEDMDQTPVCAGPNPISQVGGD